MVISLFSNDFKVNYKTKKKVGRYMLDTIRRLLRPLRLNYLCISGYLKSKKDYSSKNNMCWIIGTPDHKNLGDHAIAYATISYLKRIIPSYEIVEVVEGEFYQNAIKIKKALKPGDLIILQGGGNFGNQYQYIENIRRVAIKFFNNYPIIMFPQTIHFTNDKVGVIELKKSKSIYEKNRQLLLTAREKVSYIKMTDNFNLPCICVPDIVLSIHGIISNDAERSNILCCFRNDKEGLLSSMDRDRIFEILSEFGAIEHLDTISQTNVGPENREKEIKKILRCFSTKRLIVTDRLHGMVFAAVTNTPCIVFSNYNHKVKGVYEWIKNIANISFIDDASVFSNSNVEQVLNAQVDMNEWKNIIDMYIPLENKIKEMSTLGKNS